MLDGFDSYFNGLVAVLRTEEAEQKKRYYNAIDIEDMAEAMAVTIDARTKIQQLRKWIEDLRRIREEVTSALSDESDSDIAVAEETLSETQSEILTIPNEGCEAVFSQNIEEGIADEPTSFTFLDKTYAVDGWQELLIKLCETMILNKPYRIAGFGVSCPLNTTDRTIFSFDETQTAHSPKRLSNGLFVETDGSAIEIKSRCEHILEACGYSLDVFRIG
ncbi:MAG: hypothetical protein LBS35_09050 [Synergistaceae bacterium]|nr:hypothetical protein [Synergistaceae bacterium]